MRNSEIKTFVRRKQNRMTAGQKKALTSSSKFTEVPITQIDSPVILDVGFGMGDSLLDLSENYSNHTIVGVDIYQPGIARALNLTREIPSILVVDADATEVLTKLPAGYLAGLQLMFPDPWPKKRHHKRRFIQAERLELIYQKLLPGGWLRLVTDNDSYALQAEQVFAASNFCHITLSYQQKKTKYWLRAEKLGNTVHEFMLEK